MSEAVVRALPASLSPAAALSAVRDLPFPLLLESATRGPGTGQCSFLTADPIETSLIDRVHLGEDPFDLPRRWINQSAANRDVPGGFTGGVAGLLGYELGHAFEKLPRLEAAPAVTPALCVGLYDWAICWDHAQNTTHLIVRDFGSRGDSPSRRADQLKSRFRSAPDVPGASVMAGEPESNFTSDEYLAGVARVIDHIRAGDIFQANLSQQLRFDFAGDGIACYHQLRAANPAPMAGYFSGPGWEVISASPERFLQLNDGRVETRPIKGTRQRATTPEADLFTGDALQESEKDRAENVMIVDLLRNDLSRVCRPGTVKVPQLCRLEAYETVQHLVSCVTGELRETADWWDLLAATFPGGSITGAPKVRAMEIISELEAIERGAYCGSLFFLTPEGQADSSILIRTFTLAEGRLICPVGGGIVFDSKPQSEYEETWHKAAGMLRAIGR